MLCWLLSYPIAVSFPAVGAVDGDRGEAFSINYSEEGGGDSVEKLVDTTTNVVSFVKGVEVKRLRLLRDASFR